MTNKLYLFSTTRAIRAYKESRKKDNSFIATTLTISDFLDKVIYFDDRVLVDSFTKRYLLHKSSQFDQFDYIKFPKSIMDFLSNVSTLSSFIDEMALEHQDISKLYEYDFYDDYKIHIKSLETLMKRYESLLDMYALVDKINIRKHFNINQNFLQNFDFIELYLDGAINSFELEIYQKVSQITKFCIHMFPNKFNQKTLNRIEKTTNIEIFKYDKHNRVDIQISLYSVNQELEQIGFVKDQIEEFVQKGINPKDIAVILPDESFAHKLDLFDQINNLNLAMGKKFVSSLVYKKLEKILKDKMCDTSESVELTELNVTLYQSIDIDQYLEIFKPVSNLFENEELREIYEKEVLKLTSLFKIERYIKAEVLLFMLLESLSECSVDDSEGGQVTVMGVLESRGISYDGVIVVDFDDNSVPKRVVKDHFLPDFLRSKTDLPTSKDREDMQRSYYHTIFSKAKKISVCFVDNGEKFVSRFIKEYDYIDIDKDSYYDRYLFNSHESLKPKDKPIISSYDFKSRPLSATKLKIYLSCKRRFYYQYIKKIQEPIYKSQLIDRAKLGSFIHKVLYELYRDKKAIDSDTLQKKIIYNINEQKEFDDLKNIFELDVWKKRLERFCHFEEERYKDGYRVFDLERKQQCKFKGFILEGIIDRIDIKDDKLYVLDYKTGEKNAKLKEDEVDFQLLFYYLLMEKVKEVDSCGYYNLKSSSLSMLEDIELQKDILTQKLYNIDSKDQEFEKTTDSKVCLYCPFKTICNV
jgi:hypothetical protein